MTVKGKSRRASTSRLARADARRKNHEGRFYALQIAASILGNLLGLLVFAVMVVLVFAVIVAGVAFLLRLVL